MSTDPIQTLLVAANYYDAMSETGGARDALARLEQLRDAGVRLDKALTEVVRVNDEWNSPEGTGVTTADHDYAHAEARIARLEFRAALARFATTQENT